MTSEETSNAGGATHAGDRCFEKEGTRFRKRFRPEERASRDHEAAALARAAGPLVPPVLELGEDAQGPWLDLEDCGDLDLRQLVASSGPLPTDATLSLAGSCARALQIVHERGVVHGDVKPANFLLDAKGALGLVDFENAHWEEGGEAHGPAREGFTGGTHGYAPVEARLGARPDARFDVFGFGATLHFLLVGFRPPLREDGSFDSSDLDRLRPTLDRELRDLLLRTLAKEPEARPELADIEAELQRVRPPTRIDIEFEIALLEGRDAELELSSSHDSRLQTRVHWGRRLDRVLQAIPVTELDHPIDQRLASAERFCSAALLALRFVPLLPRLRERLLRAQIKIPDLLRALPGRAKQLFTTGQLSGAGELAERAIRLASLVAELPFERRDIAQLLSGVLGAAQSIQRHVHAEEPKQRELWQQIEEAELRFDWSSARAGLRELQERYSGTTPLTAAARDRLHRLEWLLERFASGRGAIDEARTLAPEFGGEALSDLLDRVGNAISEERTDTQPGNLDVLARVLGELLETQPKLPVVEARSELKRLRLELSSQAIRLLDQMEDRLKSDPVPIRLLSQDLEEVDRILLLGALVDTRESDRSSVLDRLERLRLRVEEITEQGRRLVMGAKDQSEHGRLTTALYDLERALEASQQEGGDDEAHQRELGIRAELERVRRLREEVQRATRRNRELAEMHQRLAAQGQETLEARMRVLEERAEVLAFLIERGSRAFGPRYREELFELRLTRARERAEDGEVAYLHERDPQAQLRIAQELLELLERTRAELEISREGPLATIEERWTNYYDRAARDARAREEERARQTSRKRKRRVWAAVLAVLLVGIGVLAWLLL